MKADQNLATFLSQGAGKTAADFQEMVMGGQLSYLEVAKEHGDSKAQACLGALSADTQERMT